MKRATVVVLTFIPLCSILSAQQRRSSQWGKAVLEVSGTKLHLGMTKAEVSEKLSGRYGVRTVGRDARYVQLTTFSGFKSERPAYLRMAGLFFFFNRHVKRESVFTDFSKLSSAENDFLVLTLNTPSFVIRTCE
jgi:hypothetical protein